MALQLVPITALIKGVGEGGAVEAEALRSVALAVTKYCHGLARRALEFARRGEESPQLASQQIHIRHDDLMEDPLKVIEQIYARFGMELTASHRAAMAADLRLQPAAGLGGSRLLAQRSGAGEGGCADEGDAGVP